MKRKHLYINTMGCQMNVYDSDQIRNHLEPIGYFSTEDLNKADLIFVNTCSIRAKAEQKAFSFLGRLVPLKKRKPDLIIGIGGCVAQQEGNRILSRMPHVDLVFGTQAIGRLPRIIERIAQTRCRVVDVDIDPDIDASDYIVGLYRQSESAAFVTIMRGCDNYCTYCIVPYVRGRESSRAPNDILSEIHHLVASGTREVTLLGQNVNSYGQKEGLCTFTELLNSVNEIPGLERIRFTTSHPKDLSDDLIEAFGRLDKLCHHVHLPVQSGSDRILKRMNRCYTRQGYMEKIERLRNICPDIAITSDIIVGFPGETDMDFDATISLINEVAFDSLFAFIYSDRPHAPAVRFEGKIDEVIKKERLQQVLNCQKRYSHQSNQTMVGKVQQVLVESRSKGQALDQNSGKEMETGIGEQWMGRTTTNKIVHFINDSAENSDNLSLTGCSLDIMIERALPHCLWGRPVPPVIIP